MSARSRQLSVYLAIFCLALAACGGGGGGDDEDADPQPTTTSPSTTQSPEDADEQALRHLAEDWFEAVRTAYTEDTDLAELEQFAADPYLTGVQEQITSFRETGNEAQPGDQTVHEVVSVELDGGGATLVECVIDADLVLTAEGAVINDEVQANLYETDASLVDGSWRLTGRRTLVETDGSNQCPAQ